MIAKITGAKNFYSVLKYNTDKVKEDKATVLLCHKISFPPPGKEFNLMKTAQEFEEFLPPKCRTVNPVIHISLNPSPDDHLSDEKMLEIALDYLKQTGYENQPYMIFKHSDIDRQHLHIVSIRIEENGKKISNYNDFKKSKTLCRELEKKYNLHPAVRKDYINEIPLKKLNYTDGDITRKIKDTVKGLADSYTFQSMGEFKALLSLYNISTDEIKGEVKGKTYHGIVYSVAEAGNQKSVSVKSSRIGKNTGYEALQKKFLKSRNDIQKYNLKAHTKRIVSTAMSQHNRKEDFEKFLMQNGITPLFRENESGRIYGATFIDHYTKSVFNGSELGKEFSANAFQDLFHPAHPQNGAQVVNRETGICPETGNDIFLPVFDSLYDDPAPLPDDALIREQGRKKRKKRKRGI